MAADETPANAEVNVKVLAEMDCFRRFYHFRQLSPELADPTRFFAWLEYKEAVFQRDRQQCFRCGQVRPVDQLDVRPVEDLPGVERLAPGNLQSICVFCQTQSGLIRPRRHGHPE
jgi:hypothetical protein